MDVSTINYWLALGTVALQLGTLFLLVLYFAPSVVPGSRALLALVDKWGLIKAWSVALGAALINQFYNAWLGIPPCDLCWWGRIFLYPQPIFFAFALWCERYRAAAIDFSIALSAIGAGISLYHHLLQMFPNSLPCPATGVSCAQRFMFEFGYITYPLMAFSLFAFLIVLMLLARSRRAA